MWAKKLVSLTCLLGMFLVLVNALDETQIVLQPTYTVKTPTIAAGQFVAVPVAANVPTGPTADALTFGLNLADLSTNPFPDPTADPIGTWEGPTYSSPLAAHNQHYAGRVNITGNFLALRAIQSASTSFLLYALSNATQSAVAAVNIYNTTLDFDGRSQLIPANAYTLIEDDTVDTDSNGVPNDPATIPDNTAYVTNSAFDAGIGAGQTLFANLQNTTTVPNVFTFNGLEIQAPTRAALQSAGAIAAGENAFLLVKRVDNLADMPNLTPNFANGAAWATDCNNKAAAVGTQISSTYLISLLKGAPGADLLEVGNISSAPIFVRLTANITDPAAVTVQSFDISVVDQLGAINVVELGNAANWSLADAAPTVDQANGLVDGVINSGTASLIQAIQIVDDPPTANCKNITVPLDITGNASILASAVNNGSTDDNGIASLSVLPNTFTCADIGANNVTLTVTDTIGQTATCNATVTITDPLGACSPPVANFSSSATNLNVTFTNSSQTFSASNITYAWDFGDTNTSSAVSPAHTYATVGTYSVTLTVTTELGTNFITKNVTVGLPPTANFSSNAAELDVSFTNTSQTLNATSIVYAWTFGDSNTSSAMSPSHLYANPGTYTVSLTVTTEFGTDSTSQNITIGFAPTADFTFSVNHLDASFTNSSQTFTATSVVYAWDFGDTNFSSATSPSHSYALEGTYPVKLTVTTEFGADTITQFVTVTAIRGACCFPDGTCFVVMPANCASATGTYQGDDSDCGAVSCPVITTPVFHSADQDADHTISLTELLRVIQFFNFVDFHCDGSGEDGYNPGIGDQTCSSHSSDYNTQNWKISLLELLRLIQFFNMGGYFSCSGVGEDNFCPVQVN